jgi:hypothetical protein
MDVVVSTCELCSCRAQQHYFVLYDAAFLSHVQPDGLLLLLMHSCVLPLHFAVTGAANSQPYYHAPSGTAADGQPYLATQGAAAGPSGQAAGSSRQRAGTGEA